MKVEPFDCCSAYNECSDLGRCIWEADKRNACTYWIRHLSNGVAFYGKNPGLIEGYIFIKVGGRAFRISKRRKDFSYIMDRNYRNTLTEGFKAMGIPFSTKAEGDCVVTGCPENPAKYKIDFAINDNEYTIKNYNGWAMEANVVQQIIEEMGDRIKLAPNPSLSRQANRTSIYQEIYYGRETAVVFSQWEQPKVPEGNAPNELKPQSVDKKGMEGNIKLLSGDRLNQGKLVQVSIWDIMWGRV